MNKITSNMVLNPQGVEVPSNLKEHLHWWLDKATEVEFIEPAPEFAPFMLTCAMNEKDVTPVPPELRENPVIKSFERCSARFGVRVTPWAAVLVSGLCKTGYDIPLWMSFILVYSIAMEVSIFEIRDLMLMFPVGIPSEESMIKLWVLQKLPGTEDSNLLDHIKVILKKP